MCIKSDMENIKSLSDDFKANARTPQKICPGCGWMGNECDCINPGGLGDDKYVEGDRCPACWEVVEDYE